MLLRARRRVMLWILRIDLLGGLLLLRFLALRWDGGGMGKFSLSSFLALVSGIMVFGVMVFGVMAFSYGVWPLCTGC